MSYKLFIFDFDGTLGDTKEGIVASFQEALRKNGLPIVDGKQIIQCMGLSLKNVFKKLIQERTDAEFYEKLVADYRTFYKDLSIDKTFLFPEVAETLRKLKEKGILTSIATSKRTEGALLSCKYLHIDKYFDFCIGDDMVAQGKPNPEMLLVTLRRFGVDYRDAVMIGDSTFDIEMGKAIGMDTIAVTWGAHAREILQEYKPNYMIDSFSELMRFV